MLSYILESPIFFGLLCTQIPNLYSVFRSRSRSRKRSRESTITWRVEWKIRREEE